MSALTDSLTRRIAELSAHQAELQSRADVEKGKVQDQINALITARGLLVRSPEIEPVFLTLSMLKLLPKE
jgi:hypothetical protein